MLLRIGTMLNRRLFLTGTAAFAAAAAPVALASAKTRVGFDPTLGLQAATWDAEEATDPAVRARRVGWLAKHAHEFDSIDFDDDDFEDLEAFGKAAGNARIVMLGEQTHSDGTTFLAKARLVRYLHEEMDFDVLAFEGGLYDMHRAWQRIKDGERARTAVGAWSTTREIGRLIDYVGERADRRRPLELAGVDCIFSAVSGNRVVDDLVAFLAAHRIETDTIPEWQRFRTTLERMAGGSPQWKATEEEQRLVLSTIDALAARIAATVGREATFWRQALKSTKAFTQFRFLMQENAAGTDPNLRDAAMADNLLWLAREAFPERKIIVWAATFHNLRNPHLIDTRMSEVSYAKFKTMGHLVAEQLGSAVYSVGFTAHAGQYGFVNQEPTPLDLPPVGSLEDVWGATTQQNAFLDLRRIPAGGEWLQSPILSRPLGYRPMLADWSQVLDGMVFTRTMRPCRRAR